MYEISVFQVAREIVQRTDEQEVNSAALQKLCFFSFSWYAHLTGRRLYPEATWATQRGPVVGVKAALTSRQTRHFLLYLV